MAQMELVDKKMGLKKKKKDKMYLTLTDYQE